MTEVSLAARAAPADPPILDLRASALALLGRCCWEGTGRLHEDVAETSGVLITSQKPEAHIPK